MPNDIKTDENLLRRLTAAGQGNVTREQLFKQRTSFIYGALPKDSSITKQQIERALHKVEGEAA